MSVYIYFKFLGAKMRILAITNANPQIAQKLKRYTLKTKFLEFLVWEMITNECLSYIKKNNNMTNTLVLQNHEFSILLNYWPSKNLTICRKYLLKNNHLFHLIKILNWYIFL